MQGACERAPGPWRRSSARSGTRSTGSAGSSTSRRPISIHPGQIIISGEQAKIEAAVAAAKERGIKK
jgi:hypothetical protein